MKYFTVALLIIQAAYTLACFTEPSTIIQIKNYEGPIYLQSPRPCEEKIYHQHKPAIGCDYDCTCVAKPSCACVPINTASQCSSGGYNGYPNWYQDQCTVQQVFPCYSSVPQDDCSFTCGKCGRKISYY